MEFKSFNCFHLIGWRKVSNSCRYNSNVVLLLPALGIAKSSSLSHAKALYTELPSLSYLSQKRLPFFPNSLSAQSK